MAVVDFVVQNLTMQNAANLFGVSKRTLEMIFVLGIPGVFTIGLGCVLWPVAHLGFGRRDNTDGR